MNWFTLKYSQGTKNDNDYLNFSLTRNNDVDDVLNPSWNIIIQLLRIKGILHHW